MISAEMSELLGQPIVIESRPGAAGTIGAREVAQAKADGYMGLMNASIQLMYPGIFKHLAFDPLKEAHTKKPTTITWRLATPSLNGTPAVNWEFDTANERGIIAG